MKTRRVYNGKRKNKKYKKGGDAFNRNIEMVTDYAPMTTGHVTEISDVPRPPRNDKYGNPIYRKATPNAVSDADANLGISLKKQYIDKCNTSLRRVWNWNTCRKIKKSQKMLGAKYGYGGKGRKTRHRKK